MRAAGGTRRDPCPRRCRCAGGRGGRRRRPRRAIRAPLEPLPLNELPRHQRILREGSSSRARRQDSGRTVARRDEEDALGGPLGTAGGELLRPLEAAAAPPWGAPPRPPRRLRLRRRRFPRGVPSPGGLPSARGFASVETETDSTIARGQGIFGHGLPNPRRATLGPGGNDTSTTKPASGCEPRARTLAGTGPRRPPCGLPDKPHHGVLRCRRHAEGAARAKSSRACSGPMC